MPQYILQTQELCKEFAHTAAVNRVSMNIQQGDIYGFIGEMGQEKQLLCVWLQDLHHPHLAQSGYLGRKTYRQGGTILGARLKIPLCIKI